MKLGLFVRNFAKLIIQNCILPVACFFAKLKNKERTLYVFADAHNTSLPYSLAQMYNKVVEEGIEPVCHFYDYTHEGAFKSLIHSIKFMDIYAKAKYVFICDTFMPVSSGRKPKGTKVVQLCHFSGPFKKIGYATTDDIPAFYSKNVFKNYDLVSVSSPLYEPIITDAMRQKEGVVRALGVSRSDIFYNEGWVKNCREEFYKAYPEAKNKKVLLWAPTFRGDASSPAALDNKYILDIKERLGDDWIILIKHHPHDDAVAKSDRYRSNCNIPSEKLLPVVDLLVSDYSTVTLDYLAFNKPFVLYAPDYEKYEKERGFFIDYKAITKNIAFTPEELGRAIFNAYESWLRGDMSEIEKCKETFVSACDGNATQRILDYIRK